MSPPPPPSANRSSARGSPGPPLEISALIGRRHVPLALSAPPTEPQQTKLRKLRLALGPAHCPTVTAKLDCGARASSSAGQLRRRRCVHRRFPRRMESSLLLAGFLHPTVILPRFSLTDTAPHNGGSIGDAGLARYCAQSWSPLKPIPEQVHTPGGPDLETHGHCLSHMNTCTEYPAETPGRRPLR